MTTKKINKLNEWKEHTGGSVIIETQNKPADVIQPNEVIKIKDWTGNKRSTFATLGASNHSKHDRQARDYYATDPATIPVLLEQLEKDNIQLSKNIWENASGGGHLANKLKEIGYNVLETDIEPQNETGIELDFLGDTPTTEEVKDIMCGDFDCYFDIITNPPYKYAKEWTEKSMELLEEGRYLIMFLKLTFLESEKRLKLFKKYPPKYVYVFSKRQKCAINGDFGATGSSATAYAWFVWEKGFDGDPIIKWI